MRRSLDHATEMAAARHAGAQIRLAREAQGWRLRDLQAATRFSIAYLSQIENGNLSPPAPPATIRIVREALGLDTPLPPDLVHRTPATDGPVLEQLAALVATRPSGGGAGIDAADAEAILRKARDLLADHPPLPVELVGRAAVADDMVVARLGALLYGGQIVPLSSLCTEVGLTAGQVRVGLRLLDRRLEMCGRRVVEAEGQVWEVVASPHVDAVAVPATAPERRLTRAQYETVAMCAYHHGLQKSEVAHRRGVDSAGETIDILVALGLLRPVLIGSDRTKYCVTPLLFASFGVASTEEFLARWAPDLLDRYYAERAAAATDATIDPTGRGSRPVVAEETASGRQSAATAMC